MIIVPLTPKREVQVLAIFAHGCLFTLHSIGLVYNFRRRNKLDCVIHASMLLYEGVAVTKHIMRE